MLALRGVSKSFGEKRVLTDVTFTFPEGEVTALRGPSGCGKTTLAHIILGLVEPDAGSVERPREARVAAVFQEDRLIEHFSAMQNLQLTSPADVDASRMRAALRSLGLDADDRKRVSQYSGGMRRRVAIARAALYRPDLIVLDEPFKGLDAHSREYAARFVLETCPRATILLVTHAPEEAALMGATATLYLGGDARAR